jgi:hypothetical protein
VVGPLFADTTYILRVDEGLVLSPHIPTSCISVIKVTPPTPDVECTLTPASKTIAYGGTATLTWTSKGGDGVTFDNGIGDKPENGSLVVGPLFADTTYILRVDEGLVLSPHIPTSCISVIKVTPPFVPTCDLFTANPTAITVGGSSTLTWESTNAVQAFINNGIGAVAVDGSVVVSPIVSTTYVLTLIGDQDKTIDCQVPVTVSEDPLPICESFTASPSTFGSGGGVTTLDWRVINATEVTIDNGVGAVALTGNTDINITESTTFKLTAKDASGDEVSCIAPVAVGDPAPFTCEGNVTFTTSAASITAGQNATLNWSTVDVDSLTITHINLPGLSGTKEVSPSDDITYTLTAIQGSRSIDCPISIDVSTGGGGGGGGSSSPRCELEISDTKIKRGEEITLTWDTARATEVTLIDDEGEIIFTTDDYLSSDKKEYYDGSVTLKPTRNTEYTLIAERGSRDKKCSVEVEMDDLVVLQTRDQQPLVAGISLSQVPYTGFEAGPVMTIMFYMLLVAWALYITYLIIIRKKDTGVGMETPVSRVEEVRQSAAAPIVENIVDTTPSNLPTGGTQIGFSPQVVVPTNTYQVTDSAVTELENRAHSQKALLSSDAVRHFIATTEGDLERNEVLDDVISEAKSNYPLEDGWIVINESRMKNLCVVCMENSAWASVSDFIPASVPAGSGSLAEAIVTGNIVAAYDMIGNRPMFALADAAADLDALYRTRKGEDVLVSELLKTETANLSDEQIMKMISSLTSAIDGTYNDEASAVKMAIMKAVKEVA